MDETRMKLDKPEAEGAAEHVPMEMEPGAAPEWTGIVRELGELGAGAILTEAGLARLFARHPVSVKRAVARGELPSPTRLFGAPAWTAGSIVRHVEKRLKGGAFQGWYVDAQGRQRFFRGTGSRAETLRVAQALEDQHRQVRLGYRAAPSSADRHRARPFAEAAAEYCDWGASQGGHGGRPWGPKHGALRRKHLAFWQDRLGIETLADVPGVLPRAEKTLREMQGRGLAGKTLSNVAEALRAFCRWSIERGYLAEDPLRGLARFDATPRTRRRAMTSDEIHRLLEACAPHRRLLYEVALVSGLRARELLSLSAEDLDTKRGGLVLHAEWTKGRRGGFQHLPAPLVERLDAFARAGGAVALYRRFPRAAAPANPLLCVPLHTARELDKDLRRAGVPKLLVGGKLDFHACRVGAMHFTQVPARPRRPEKQRNREAGRPVLRPKAVRRVHPAVLRSSVLS